MNKRKFITIVIWETIATGTIDLHTAPAYQILAADFWRNVL